MLLIAEPSSDSEDENRWCPSPLRGQEYKGRDIMTQSEEGSSHHILLG